MDAIRKFEQVIRAIQGMPDEPGQPPVYPLLGLYRAQVIRQSSDLMTFDVQPETPMLAAFQRVPLRQGLPGISVQFAASPGPDGTYAASGTVLIGFLGGDPSKPYLHSWEGPEKPYLIKFAADQVQIGKQQSQQSQSAQLTGSGQPPIPTAGAALGSGGSAIVVADGTDSFFELQLTSGSGPTTGLLATVKMSQPFPTKPKAVFSAASAVSTPIGIYCDRTDSAADDKQTLVIKCAVAPPPGLPINLIFHVAG